MERRIFFEIALKAKAGAIHEIPVREHSTVISNEILVSKFTTAGATFYEYQNMEKLFF